MAVPRNTHLIIADELRQKIRNGEFTERLPTRAQIADSYGVSHSTVMRALRILTDENLIEIIQGNGVYLAGARDTRPLTDRLTELLQSGQFTVGSMFPSEPELSRKLRVSRPTLRNALACLEGQGLLEAVAGRGRTVLALTRRIDKEAE